MPEGVIYVGRPGPWGNPFSIDDDHNAAEIVDLYRSLLSGYLVLSSPVSLAVQRQAVAHVKAHIEELRGRDLACWCALDEPCHADVLIEAAQRTPAQRAAAFEEFKAENAALQKRV